MTTKCQHISAKRKLSERVSDSLLMSTTGDGVDGRQIHRGHNHYHPYCGAPSWICRRNLHSNGQQWPLLASYNDERATTKALAAGNAAREENMVRSASDRPRKKIANQPSSPHYAFLCFSTSYFIQLVFWRLAGTFFRNSIINGCCWWFVNESVNESGRLTK